ncbi:hypothetical protein PR048_006540 [Dryococelus australis]|uniref:Uncharacterized protein n=1 Tax=Dryococelus australis TaxID=614101 RepID=A0ABQ9IB90_9NEOP|nr:hypothetical protein PR048_006540 [Dryococelus australis]
MNAEGKKKTILSKELVRNVRMAGLQQEGDKWRIGRDKSYKTGKLVVTSINTQKKAVQTLKHHASTDYHKGNMIASHNLRAAEKKK